MHPDFDNAERASSHVSNDLITDPDNPEWTEADFAAAMPASEMPSEVLAVFANGRKDSAAR